MRWDKYREREKVLAVSHGPSRTKQAERDGANINSIMKRYGTTGVLPVTGKAPTYGDFSNVDDYKAALDKLNAAQEDYARLPAEVRAATNHSPGEFLDMVHDEDRRGELRELGLLPDRDPVEIEKKALIAAEPETPGAEGLPPIIGGE